MGWFNHQLDKVFLKAHGLKKQQSAWLLKGPSFVFCFQNAWRFSENFVSTYLNAVVFFEIGTDILLIFTFCLAFSESIWTAFFSWGRFHDNIITTWRLRKQHFFLPNSTHMPHGTGIFTYIYHKKQPNVDKFTSLMDLIKVGICLKPGNFVKKAVILGEHCQIARVSSISLLIGGAFFWSPGSSKSQGRLVQRILENPLRMIRY